MRYGLIGNPLGHSWSPRIHALLGDYDYRAYPLEENEIAAFLAEKDLGGLNVTRPYKKTVIPYCAEISGAAREIGSVNTLCFTNRGIVGYNTDCDGFFAMAKRAGIDFKDKKVVILGTGGTMLTARYCAKIAGARGNRRRLPQRRGQLREHRPPPRRGHSRQHDARGDVPRQRARGIVARRLRPFVRRDRRDLQPHAHGARAGRDAPRHPRNRRALHARRAGDRRLGALFERQIRTRTRSIASSAPWKATWRTSF